MKIHEIMMIPLGIVAIPLQIYGMTQDGFFSFWLLLMIMVVPGFIESILKLTGIKK